MKLKIFVAWLTGMVTALLVVAIGVGFSIRQSKRNAQRDREDIARTIQNLLHYPLGVGFTSPDVMQMPEAMGILLETLLHDDRVSARIKAVDGLRYHQTPDVVSALCQAVRTDSESDVRRFSLEQLENFKQCAEFSEKIDTEMQGCIQDALNDPNDHVQQQASSTLKLFRRGGSVVF